MSTINALSVTASVSSADKLPMWSNANGVTRGLPISVLDARYLSVDNVAALAASPTVETFVSGTDFTPGVSVALTVANQYYSAQNIEVFFDASYQGPDQYSLIGLGLVFNSAIPVGVQNVYVRGGSVRQVGTPSQGTVIDSMVASGTALYDRVFNVVSVEDFPFNASPSNSDNSSAVQAAVTYALATGKALRVPRKYSLLRQITGSGSLVMYGAGMDLSGFNWPASSSSFGFAITLTLNPTSLSATAAVSDIFFSTGAAAVGTALQFTGASNTSLDRITPRVNINRVLIRGATNPVNDGFQKGLVFDNCTGVVVEQYNWWGKNSSSGAPHYDSISGIDYNNNSGGNPHPTELAVSHSIINGAQTGINTNNYEGALIHDCQIVGVNAGVRFSTPGPGYPHANVHDCHINADAICVAVQGMYEIFIHDNLLYNQMSLTPGTGVSVSNGSQFVNVHDNIFENFNQSIAMTAISFDNCQWSIAQGNIFRRCDSIDGTAHGLGVWMTVNSANCKAIAHDQMFIATTTAFLNQGTNNALIT